jgi:hypothetical protein
MDDLDDHLPWRDRPEDLLADRFLCGLLDEFPRDREGNVGLEQCNAYLAHRRAHIGIRQGATAPKAVKNAAEPIAQRVKHSNLLNDAEPHMGNLNKI